MKLIALTGKAGAGKDTVADRLCEKHGFVRYAFAKPLKDMLAAIGVDANNRETKELPHPLFGASPRRMAQTLGTEWGREMVNPDIWLKCAEVFIAKYSGLAPGQLESDGDPYDIRGIVITDCRFENEAAFVRQRGGVIWEIRRPGIEAVEGHVSEAGIQLANGDHWFENNGTIEQLHAIVDQAVGMGAATLKE